ncbi:hypothetical protein G6F59_018499 [Rhizopus arrhizus]|nr:hypothetical protein G6F59_018499 [Rhizopus arrhizus]
MSAVDQFNGGADSGSGAAAQNTLRPANSSRASGARARSVRSRRSMPSIEHSSADQRGGIDGTGTAGSRRHSTPARAAISRAASR